ncbi:hypothetical protein [Paenarthrobacter nitroguajacolicus]|uniref:hypothetical protein n=1 Tax=Paenarthrobacter nitroguajacolicus TaxID=211146 RepID=UPI0015BC9664|nr:hypothetical protein [Paenarthrobacter nitroguajacolicus]NWL35539.1 hypothetical protein [Paenarthrobacter nitroguajacolicus]
MQLINSEAPTVPFGRYKGRSLQELVQFDHQYANWMVSLPNFHTEYPKHYDELLTFLKMAGLYKAAGLREPWRAPLNWKRRR